MGEWIKVRLGDCIKEINERTTENNQYQVLSVTKDGIFSQEEYFKKQIASENNIGYKILRKNNLVFSTMNLWMGSLDVLTNYEIGIVSPAYKIFEFNEELMLPEFGNYFMKSYYMLEQYKNFSEQGASIVRRNLDLKALLNVEIMLPPVKEQKKIVSILENIDKIINKYEELLAEKNQYNKSKFVEMFGDVILNSKGWNVVKWNDVLSIKNGKSQKDVENSNGKYPIYGSGGIIGYSDDYICNEGTIILGRKGSINNPFVVNTKCWNVDTAFGIEPKLDKICLQYLYMFCLIFNFNKLDQASTIPSLTKNDLLNIKIPLPPLELQEKFSKIVIVINEQKLELKKLIRNYEKLKKGLMQQLLTGKIRVKI